MIEAAADLEVIAETSDVGELGRIAAALGPDVLVLDGLAAPAGTPVVRLSDEPVALDGVPVGAVPRDADSEELLAAVRAVAAGLIAVSPALLAVGVPVRHLAVEGEETLTAREREVLQLLAEGIPNKQVARRLGVSPHTVKFHVASLLAKLGATSRTEAVTVGLRRGLISV